jgi:CRP/FNR family transcriptional regulator, cyclic AMP receptor protein
MREDKPWYLEHPNFLDGLTEEQRLLVERKSVIKKFGKGQIVCNMDDPSEHVYVVRKGTAKVFLLTVDGKETILAIRRKGDLIGTTSLFGWEMRVSYVAALEDLELIAIKTEDLRDMISKHMNMAILIIKILGVRLHHSRMIIYDSFTKSVEKRLARMLLDLFKDLGVHTEGGTVINLRLTHEQIAQMIGSSRQTVTLALNELEGNGIIRKDRKRITILDGAALQDLAE